MVSLESEIPSMNNENFVADDCKQESEVTNMKSDNFVADDFKQEMNTKVLDDGKQQPDTQYNRKYNKKGRGDCYPQETINILKEWLFQNSQHPYPSDKQCYDLAKKTGLTFQQVKMWFINGRRRFLPNDKKVDKASLNAKVNISKHLR